MSETIGQHGGIAALAPRGIGEILSTAFQLYGRYWRTLLPIASTNQVLAAPSPSCRPELSGLISARLQRRRIAHAQRVLSDPGQFAGPQPWPT